MSAAVSFVGLGTMGFRMAGRLARQVGAERCFVWNRTGSVAERHAAEFKSVAIPRLSALGPSPLTVLCLPTTAEDELVVEELAPRVGEGACIVSCTSGDPAATRELALSLRERFGVHFLDCPVSGGPRGAEAGTLTGMLGGDSAEAMDRAEPLLRSFLKRVVRCGPSGAGNAIKAVNNALNCAHLLLGAEGLLVLQKAGVDPDVALHAINGSSGRSLQTEVRLPEEVLTGNFAYGFKLNLMAKDVRTAISVMDAAGHTEGLLPVSAELVKRAAQEEARDADYTRIVCQLERRAGIDLRVKKAGRSME